MTDSRLPAFALFNTQKNDDDDAKSDWTIELDDSHRQDKPHLFGHPLRRMVDVSTLSSDSEEDELEKPEDDEDEEDSPFMSDDLTLADDWDDGSTLTRSPSWEYVQSVAAEMKKTEPKVAPPPSQIFYRSPDDAAHGSDLLMIKRIPASSTELEVLRLLNSDPLRLDPWNPAVPVLHIVENEDQDAFVIMERLYPFTQPPLKEVRDALDFVRQMIQSVTFLHEQGIAHLDLDADNIMMEIGHAPLTHTNWTRSEFPVRYYCVDFAHAKRVDSSTLGLSTDPETTKQKDDPFRVDVVACARTIERLFGQAVPELDCLVTAMTTKDISAEESRILFEALSKRIDFNRLGALLEP